VTGKTAHKDWRSEQSFAIGRLLERLRGAPSRTVIVPVHNGGTAVAKCLVALLEHTRSARIIIIDDATRDREVLRLLAEIESDPRVELVRHETNLGYTRTVNHGIQMAGSTSDVILLNSDTVVGPLWLQQLAWVAYSQPSVGTVTAVSDNAGAMSVPVTGQANVWAEHIAQEECARSYAREMALWSIEAPTGNGFCMYITRLALDRIGLFDERAFPRGYGEENDFCMRARKFGMINLIATRVLVHHERSQSFGPERDQLVRQGRSAVDERHPEYTGLIRNWLSSPAMKALRVESSRAREEVRKQSAVLPRRLYVLHRSGGGTPATNQDLIAALDGQQESLLLDSVAGQRLELFRWNGRKFELLRSWEPEHPIKLVDTWRDDYALFVAEILLEYRVELIHIRHLINHPLTTLVEVARLLDIPAVL
jgi:GT2 family glycosyltransferase